jgi:predicted O-methyltransferase YrrM
LRDHPWIDTIRDHCRHKGLRQPLLAEDLDLSLPNCQRFLPPSQSDIRNHDRLLPSQPAMRQFFKGEQATFYRQVEQVTNSVLPIGSVHEKWDIRLKPGITYETLGSDLSSLHFLQLLVRHAAGQRVLEIGTYVGVSTLFLAEAVGEGGHVVTVEVGAEFAEIARENFLRNGLLDRIELINDDAANALSGLRQRKDLFDVIFLDGDKGNYGRLLGPLFELLKPGGVMVVDDVFCNGDTLNEPATTSRGRGVQEMLRQVASLGNNQRVILPYGNGQLLLLKAT